MVDLVIESRRRSLGGFDVGRVLPFPQRRMVGPFIFFDVMGPVDFAPGVGREVDVRPHPHIGLSTVTYLFEGEIVHRDSVGSEQPIRPGAVNWMAAGRGITHSERFERARTQGGAMHGIQSWVALPDEHEETDPAFDHYPATDLPVIEDGGLWTRLLAGRAFGQRSTVRTHSPLFYLHCVLQPGARMALPDEYPERAVYIVEGEVEADGQVFTAGRMLVFGAGKPALVTARSPALLMALGGEPVGPRLIEWNFVSSHKDRIEQAKAEWRAGRMKLPDLDDADPIPFPGDPSPEPDPMS